MNFSVRRKQCKAVWPAIGFLALLAAMPCDAMQVDSNATRIKSELQTVVAETQTKMVKINGSGGFRGLESYQSGFCISEDGLILTAWSYVLDADVINVTLDDGQRLDGKLLGYDPRLEIAVLKVDASGLAHFNLDAGIEVKAGARILAFSNLYRVATGDEPVSVQRGYVAGVTKLSARKGATQSVYQGDAYLLDAITNNPGASGGAIVDRQGRLIGMIGKELRDAELGTWLNFAIPIDVINASVQEIRSGKMIVQNDAGQRKPTEPMTLDLIGTILVPNVVNRTPPFIDRVVPGSASEKAGLQADDLIISIDGRLTPGIKEVQSQLESIDRDAKFEMTIRRGKSFEVIEIRL